MPSWFKPTEKNEQYKSRLRQDDIESRFPESDGVVSNTFDILENFPFWLAEKHNNNETDLINFTQAYYDWLYSHKSGYKFDIDGLQSLMDIDTASSDILKFYLRSYAHGFPEEIIGTLDDGEEHGISESEVKDFIKNIRQDLFQKKSNEEAYRYFFNTLYEIADEDVDFHYPKTDMLRLNGGRFEGWKSAEEGNGQTGSYSELNHLGGSWLNGSLIQDSDWIQEFSYLISTPFSQDGFRGTTDIPYADVMKELIHPVGLKVIYEKTMEDYIPPSGETSDAGGCVMPAIGNYYPYKLSTNNSINGCSGCHGGFGSSAGFDAYYDSVSYDSGSESFYYMRGSGETYGGEWEVDGVSFSDFNIPTHVYPDWTVDGITGTDIGNIKISQIWFMCSDSASPNAGITYCGGSLAGCTA